MLTPGLHTQELQRLDVLMRDIIDIDMEIRTHEQTLKGLHQQVVTGEEIVSLLSTSHIPLTCSNLPEQCTGAIPSASTRDAGRVQRKDY